MCVQAGVNKTRARIITYNINLNTKKSFAVAATKKQIYLTISCIVYNIRVIILTAISPVPFITR